MLQEFPVAVGGDPELDTGSAVRRQVVGNALLEGLYLAVMTAVAGVVGLVGHLLRGGVVAEDGIEDIRARNPAFREDAWVEPAEKPDVADQSGVIAGLALILGQELRHQPEVFQLGEHLLHGREHGIVGVHERAMPVEEDKLRARQGVPAHDGVPLRRPGSVPPGAAGG